MNIKTLETIHNLLNENVRTAYEGKERCAKLLNAYEERLENGENVSVTTKKFKEVYEEYIHKYFEALDALSDFEENQF